MADTPWSGPVRVMLVDDHAVVREGYHRLIELEPDFLVVDQHAHGDSALAALAARTPPPVDLVVMDLSMPGGGVEFVRRVAEGWPQVRRLVFSMHDRPSLVAQAIAAGADGFVTKGSEPQALIDALRAVAAGRRPVLSPDLSLPPPRRRGDAPHETLAPREAEVLQELLQGRSVEQIAERLSVSAKTVSNYQTLIRQKLGVTTALELLRYGREHGLLLD